MKSSTQPFLNQQHRNSIMYLEVHHPLIIGQTHYTTISEPVTSQSWFQSLTSIVFLCQVSCSFSICKSHADWRRTSPSRHPRNGEQFLVILGHETPRLLGVCLLGALVHQRNLHVVHQWPYPPHPHPTPSEQSRAGGTQEIHSDHSFHMEKHQRRGTTQNKPTTIQKKQQLLITIINDNDHH